MTEQIIHTQRRANDGTSKGTNAMDQKPIAKKYAVSARPNRSANGGYTGWFSIPGKDEQPAREDDGQISVFDTEDEAIAAAGEDLCKAMNERTRFSYKHNYRRIGGAELAVQMKLLNLSPATLAIFYGTEQRRVLQWLDGEQDVPWPVSLLLAVLSVPGMTAFVQGFVDQNISQKERKEKGEE